MARPRAIHVRGLIHNLPAGEAVPGVDPTACWTRLAG